MKNPIEIVIPVAWGDMDAFGHVNNTVFFKWCESARIKYFEQIGFLESQAQGVGPILAEIRCRFRRPVFYPDQIRVEVSMSRLGENDFDLQYICWSQSHDERVANAEDRCVVYDYREARKVLWPQDIRERILELQPDLKSQPELKSS